MNSLVRDQNEIPTGRALRKVNVATFPDAKISELLELTFSLKMG
jgi:hypothetical protein